MENYKPLRQKQQEYFRSNQTKSISFRLEALDQLRSIIKAHEQEIIDALRKDLNKSEFEAYTTEIGILLEEIKFTKKHLHKWAKPRKVKTALSHTGTKGYIYPQPYGSALIIAPWNYPFQLAIAPLIGAISAGNCAIIKPSELTPAISALIKKMIESVFPEEYIAVVEGAVETSQALLNEPFDYLFFTGSVPVGKIVMEAASKHLTPLTLELGGKSPAIVHHDADLKLAAKRIAWGKFINAGQTCIAPDYVYVHEKVRESFLTCLKDAIADLYGKQPLENRDYTHIVSEKHFNRLQEFLTSGQIAYGGKTNKENLSIEPTVITDVNWGSPIMGDEIFGPLLPIMEYKDIDDVIAGVLNFPNPLALYLFTSDKQIEHHVLESISFGGGCINDTLYHLATPHLPFGGVGTSGMGSYHGKSSFNAFSHEKSVLKQSTVFDMPFRYPNSKDGLKWIRRFLG
ncbi:aldehyde dehydrogenase [Cytobacillus gottheilii]|uniref:Aldehyde dehydrogenase n=1 Tax=Cytobacillus gottheilii TaxID=859144 RepID=A0ABX8FAB4_9BACI|nr:aldehyde dehydrogenase [Cytobacillus gottheilii]QVY61065.1 aldehyde dehydrogenase [Cytobacillus gottheilii]